jgi:hypothetical protein
VTIEVPPPQPTPEIELPSQVQKDVEVAIYRVDFEDLNADGQVDDEELPPYEKVLEEELDDERMRTRKVIKPAEAGETPTQDDIEREKLRLLNDPSQPSGAYAIIKQDADGNRTVLDVFSIRDWPQSQANDESQSGGGQIPRLPPVGAPALQGSETEQPQSDMEVVPAPVPAIPAEANRPNANDSSHHLPADRQSPQLASASLLLGSLWMLRERQASATNQERNSSALAPPLLGQPHDYSRRARKRRLLNNRN